MLSKKRVNKYISCAVIITVGFCLITLTACKKRKAFNEENAQETTDSGMFRAEGDAALEDINNVISNEFLLRGKGLSATEAEGVTSYTLCGLIVDTSQIILKGIVTLSYTGLPCANRTRTGQIKVTIQDYPLKKWKQKGCVLKIDFVDFKVIGLSDGKSIKINGTAYLTNETGSTWYDMRFLNVSGLTHTMSGNDIRLGFDDGTYMVINTHRRYTYSISSSGVIYCKVEGLNTEGDKSSVESWGDSRDGNAFVSQMISPLLWNTNCGSFMPTDGEVKVIVTGKYFELNSIYGVDSNGDSFSGSTCPYGWKVSWSYKKKTNKRIFAYAR
jgi:hypothetical protein